jgi:hypothetical protein
MVIILGIVMDVVESNGYSFLNYNIFIYFIIQRRGKIKRIKRNFSIKPTLKKSTHYSNYY